jgi:hypothetical protein
MDTSSSLAIGNVGHRRPPSDDLTVQVPEAEWMPGQHVARGLFGRLAVVA